MSTAYPTFMDVCYSHVEFDKRFPKAFVREMKSRFPDWSDLHLALKRDDQVVWGLLDEYKKRLAKFTAKQIIEASENGSLQDLVDRAHKALETAEYIKTLRPRYFKKEVAAEEKKAKKFDEEFAGGQVFL